MNTTRKVHADIIKKAFNEAVLDILSKYTPESIASEIKEYINTAYKSRVLGLLGIDASWGVIRINPLSPLDEKANKALHEIVSSFEFKIPDLTEKQKNTIQKAFETEYLANLKELAQQKAEEQAIHDMKELGEKIFNTDI